MSKKIWITGVSTGFIEFNFANYKIDINQYEKLKKLYKKYLFNYVFYFAAQSGVRYSFIKPFFRKLN